VISSRVARVFLASVLALASLGAAGCMDRVTEHRVRGNAHFREGDYEGAIKEYDEGLAVKPTDAATLILRGNAQYELGRLDDAYASYAKAYAADNSAADAVRGMALIASKKNDLADAATQFERLLAMPKHEHDSATRVNLAKIYLAQGKLAEAEKQAVEAGHESGNDETVLFTLGRVYLAAGKLDEATSTFQHLIETNPGKASGPYGLAMVAAKRGDKAEALKQLQDAMTKGIPDPGAIPKEPAFAALKDDPDFLAVAAPKK
jgi:tetratricopeptide (TPR) repeat protein